MSMEQESRQLPELARPEELEHRSWLGAALSIEYGPCSVAAAELSRAALNCAVTNNGVLDAARVSWSRKLTRLYNDSWVHDKNDILEQVPRSNDESRVYGQVKDRVIINSEGLSETRLTQEVKVLPIDDPSFTKGVDDQRKSNFYSAQSLRERYSLVNDLESHSESKTTVVKVKKRFGRLKPIPDLSYTETTYNRKNTWLAKSIAGGRVLLPLATFETRSDGNCSYVQLGQEMNDDNYFTVQDDEQTNRLRLVESIRDFIANKWDAPPKTFDDFARAEELRHAGPLAKALLGECKVTIEEIFSNNGVLQSIFRLDERGQLAEFNEDQVCIQIGSVPTEKFGTLPLCAIKNAHDENAITTLGFVCRGNVVLPIAELDPSSQESNIVSDRDMTDVDKYRAVFAISTRLGLGDYKAMTSGLYDLVGEEVDASHYLAQLFDVEKRLAAKLQPECRRQEALVCAIGGLALGKLYKGRADNVHMITTSGSASGNLELNAHDEMIELRIRIKPDALEGMPLSELPAFYYDPSKPLGDTMLKGCDAQELLKVVNGFTSSNLIYNSSHGGEDAKRQREEENV